MEIGRFLAIWQIISVRINGVSVRINSVSVRINQFMRTETKKWQNQKLTAIFGFSVRIKHSRRPLSWGRKNAFFRSPRYKKINQHTFMSLFVQKSQNPPNYIFRPCKNKKIR